VTAQVNESDIGRVQIGQPINFTVDAYPNQTFSGKVAILQPLGQNVQNVVSYTVTSTIDQTNVQLLPGMTATVNIIINQVRDAIEVLPESQREVIRLRDVDGVGAEEVCELLDLSAVNQRVLLHRARSKVRAALEDYLAGEDR